MRMWMVPTKNMCRKHLLGEHVEIHMLAGSILKRRSLKGFIDKNCIEVSSMHKRHDDIVQEMLSRGYNHKTPITLDKKELLSLSDYVLNYIVDANKSYQDLIGRCDKCREIKI